MRMSLLQLTFPNFIQNNATIESTIRNVQISNCSLLQKRVNAFKGGSKSTSGGSKAINATMGLIMNQLIRLSLVIAHMRILNAILVFTGITMGMSWSVFLCIVVI